MSKPISKFAAEAVFAICSLLFKLTGCVDMDEKVVLQLEQLLGHHFSDPLLLIEAFSHSSQTDDRLSSNERLEFLGDSVLALVICWTLFIRFPDYLEGDLTKIKSMIVSRKICSNVANALGLADYVNVGKGMEKTRAMKGSIAAGTIEAVIAAIYLDGGFEAASEFILRTFAKYIVNADAKQHHENFKSWLQQYSQQNLGATPDYELLDEKGPDHNKCFEVAVVIGSRRFKSGWGITKKDAEQKAAYNALIEIELLKPEESD